MRRNNLLKEALSELQTETATVLAQELLFRAHSIALVASKVKKLIEEDEKNKEQKK